MNQHYFDVPFAFSGDKTAIPDPLQAGGTVSFTEGWNNNYQRNLATDPAALPIDRATMNWLFAQITTALQALQQSGVPEFITAAQNGGVAFSYGKGSVVLWSASGNAPFTKFVSLTAGNTNTPSLSDPQGLTSGWQIEVDPIATAAQASAGTDDASIMTPLKVAQQTALRALLAGNSSQVFNVGPAVAATQAPQLQQLTAAGVTPGRLLRTTVYINNAGALQASINGGAFATVSSTFTPTSTTALVDVEVQGGGGAGGGAQACASGQVSAGVGGGAGGYCRAILTTGFNGATVAVGAGGAGGLGGAGSNGATSSFASLSATGGTGGAPTTASTPSNIPTGTSSPGVGSGGQINAQGGDGCYAFTSTNPIGGWGGRSMFGAGGQFRSAIQDGQSAASYGSGGGGASQSSQNVNKTGGNGAAGVVIVREYA